jgi:exodeoxyribonuclease-3
MRIVSFNINGIRARLHQLAELTQRYQPDIIGLQEIKVDDAVFPVDEVCSLGYHVEYHGQKGHYGVALLSRQAPVEVIRGLPQDAENAQRRLITGRFAIAEGLTVINGYFPQGESRDHPVKFPAKEAFYHSLHDWLKAAHAPSAPLVVMGDVNVAFTDADVGIGPENARRWLRSGKCAFLPEERQWLGDLQAWGLHDSFRACYPEVADRFSWFDYRSKGFDDDPRRGLRIDLILLTAPLLARLRGAGIAYDIRSMEKPSDHCPVWVDLDLD